MAYSDFSLKKVKDTFGLQTIESQSLFTHVPPVNICALLQAILARNLPLAQAINTEKARSELLIINLLLEVKEQLQGTISLFSGIDFTVDKERGLAGFCDYIIGGSAEQFYLDSPVITVVEAKNENIVSGLGQCIAEMYAAQIFNQQEGKVRETIYGAVTTGDEWKFLKLTAQTIHIDKDSYYISDADKIIGILIHMATA